MDSIEKAVPVLKEAGWSASFIPEQGCTFVSKARSVLLQKAMDNDVIVFLDSDMSFDPEDLLALIEAPDDVNAGTYRFKKDEVQYMGVIHTDSEGIPVVRADGLIHAQLVPAGFLKITKKAVEKFQAHYPELVYGHGDIKYLDMFNHGAHNGTWYGEDYAFCWRWNAIGGEIWLLPNLNLDHHTKEACFKGNFHKFLMAQPGGSMYKGDE